MYITISTTHRPATDLGYLLHKSPGKVHSVDLSFGVAQVFYPEATDNRCTAGLLLEIDPVELVRGRSGPRGEGLLDQYVNDRPYVSSSFTSVALARAFGTAMGGRSKSRQTLAETEIPLEVRIGVLPCRGGGDFLRRLFEPLGYGVEASRHVLDDKFPEWGESRYWSVTLAATKRLADVLQHLYVLLPVLDDDKHYWVGKDEIDKLLRRGEGWLSTHPEREEIVRRYLKHQKLLMREAQARLLEDEGSGDPDEAAEARAAEEGVLEEGISLNQQRLGSVLAALRQSGAKRVLDLGCGEGRLLTALLGDTSFTEIVGIDVSPRVLEKAADRLRLSTMAPRKREKIKLLQGSLMYRDSRLSGYDAAAVVEVVEHLDPPRLAAFERVLFREAKPAVVVMTTPNREYNVKFETMPAGAMRHKDHRFEWTRAEFQAWANRVSSSYGYTTTFLPVGPEDSVVGAPTQMGIFRRG